MTLHRHLKVAEIKMYVNKFTCPAFILLVVALLNYILDFLPMLIYLSRGGLFLG
jgi:hypothetical protein